MLEQFSYLAQIIGVVLVIASLVYVGRQLKQNTLMMQAQASGERVQRDSELNAQVSGNAEFAELWLKGIGSFDSLSEAERTRLVLFSRSAIVHWHNMFKLHRQALLPDSDWQEVVWLIENVICGRQDTLEAWKLFRGSFDPAFREFLDVHLLSSE